MRYVDTWHGHCWYLEMVGHNKRLDRVSVPNYGMKWLRPELANCSCKRLDDILYFVGERISHGSSSQPLHCRGSKATMDKAS